ncbi:hypothetical protein CPB84DRAFT_1852149 [Gymnopilus junonius]|uniref:Uncharacterized protein n=1 Tax=Gymnopilus junonius TaxID=109634 RepID=A0A9P5NCC8_GYMJU|nr:hypothetical protein CPB84DRAFT_1852149 [Gymnopilus junonius]
MRYRLAEQVSSQYNALTSPSFLSTFIPRQPLSPSEILHQPALQYIPFPFQQHIYKTFNEGLTTLFHALYILLEPEIGTERLYGFERAWMDKVFEFSKHGLTPQAVLEVASGLGYMDVGPVRFYLNKGGKVEYIFDAVIDMAKEQSALGDGSFEDRFDVRPDNQNSDDDKPEEDDFNSDSDESIDEELEAVALAALEAAFGKETHGRGEDSYTHIPKCSNDLAFDLVRKNVGLLAVA